MVPGSAQVGVMAPGVCNKAAAALCLDASRQMDAATAPAVLKNASVKCPDAWLAQWRKCRTRAPPTARMLGYRAATPFAAFSDYQHRRALELYLPNRGEYTAVDTMVDCAHADADKSVFPLHSGPLAPIIRRTDPSRRGSASRTFPPRRQARLAAEGDRERKSPICASDEPRYS